MEAPASFFETWSRLGRKTRLFTVLLMAICVLQLTGTIVPRPPPGPLKKDTPLPPVTAEPVAAPRESPHEAPRAIPLTVSLPDPAPPPHGVIATQEGPLCSAAFTAAFQQYLKQPKSAKLVWSCEMGLCGGLGDRFKGLHSAFLIAILTQREFQIYHSKPAQLVDFLVPSGPVKWNVGVSLEGLTVVRVIDNPPAAGHDIFASWGSRSVRLETNQDLVPFLRSVRKMQPLLEKLGIGDQCKDMSCLFGCLYPLLFRPEPELERRYQQIVQQHPKFISVQVRAGGNAVAWSDPMRTSMFVIRRQWEVVDKLIAERCPDCSVFITTDSQQALAEAKERFGDKLFDFPGPVVHIERSGAAARQGFAKTLIDHYIIGQGRTAVISNSGFSYTAVWRTRLNTTVVRMDKARTGYFVQKHTFPRFPVFSSWEITTGPFFKVDGQ